ncbi:MAG: hypothetical protein K2W78_05060 [Xanthobacteraceae bacterium]|nr:hypothetical protein [Xanthobacteraceae bacterium]
MESSEPKRRFPPSWKAERTRHGFIVRDANGLHLASVYCRDDLHENRWDDYQKHLTSDEARRIAKGIVRLPELLKQESAFELRYVSTSNNQYWSASHPYHVALYDPYIRENYDMITACCAMNKIPYEPTGERISHGGTWRSYRFAKQLDAILGSGMRSTDAGCWVTASVTQDLRLATCKAPSAVTNDVLSDISDSIYPRIKNMNEEISCIKNIYKTIT